MDIKELADKIEKKASVTITSLPIGRFFMMRTPDGSMAKIEVGEPWTVGGRDGSIVVALFQSTDDVRAYTVAGDPEPGKKPVPPMRYTISKHQPAVFAEMMALDTFIDEIADEWVLVDEEISSAERERDAVVAFLRGKNNILGTGLADEIEGEEHLEDDEVEDVVTSAPTIPASAS